MSTLPLLPADVVPTNTVLMPMQMNAPSTTLVHDPSLPEVYASVRVATTGGWWRRFAGFVGPGFLIAVGYMDPGNWATDIAGGSRFGYTLLFAIMVSNLLAILLQNLSLKLGIATEHDLAQVCREAFGARISMFLWIGAEIAIAACDMAEVIGSAIALELLFHLPLMWGVIITGTDVLVLLVLQRWGLRYLEALVITLIGTILVLFMVQVALCHPDHWLAVRSFMVPNAGLITNPDMLYIAIGILGATVMPHNLYLHSSLVQSRNYERNSAGKREAIWMGKLDSTLALTLALFVNGAILIVAASVFHRSGHYEVAAIQDAYQLLSPLVGAAGASTLFAVALLASGQNSSITGTLAGQVVMEGFMQIKVAPWLRRLLTRLLAIVPTVVVVAMTGEKGTEKLLIFSQVILSLQLSFAVVPLVLFTSSKKWMGEFVNSATTRRVAWLAAIAIAVMNGWLLFQMAFDR